MEKDITAGLENELEEVQGASVQEEEKEEAKESENASNKENSTENSVNGNENEKENAEEKQEELSYNELRKIAKEKGIDVPKNVKKEELVELIKKSEKPEVLSLDNQPLSPLVLTNDKEEIPRGFISLKTKPKKNSMGVFKGRMYKVIGNGYAIWCDNGQSFELKNLR